MRLEPGQWYVVSPDQPVHAGVHTPASFEPTALTTGQDAMAERELPAATSGSDSFFPAGSAVWLALSGLIVVLTASLIRPGMIGSLIRRSRARGAVFTEGSE